MAASEVNDGSPSSSVESEEVKIVGLLTNEYETQFFGFTPKSFSDGFHTAMQRYMSDAVQLVHQYVQNEFHMSKEETLVGSTVIMSAMMKVLDMACDKLETNLAEVIFKLPSGVILPEDWVQLERESPMKDQLNYEQKLCSLNEKIRNAKYVNASLREEISEVDVVRSHLDKELEYFKSLKRIITDTFSSSLKESLLFTNNQMRTLKRILGNIEMKSPEALSRTKKQNSEELAAVKKIKLDQ